MAATKEELIRVLDEVRGLLRQQGEDFWADWVDRDVEKLRRDDGEGARHFLSALGGMGSLNDMYFHPMNGNPVSEEEAERLNDHFDRLMNRADQLATELTHPEP